MTVILRFHGGIRGSFFRNHNSYTFPCKRGSLLGSCPSRRASPPALTPTRRSGDCLHQEKEISIQQLLRSPISKYELKIYAPDYSKSQVPAQGWTNHGPSNLARESVSTSHPSGVCKGFSNTRCLLPTDHPKKDIPDQWDSLPSLPGFGT